MRRLLRVSHRYAGLILSLFLLVFVVTGILLNHSPALGLSSSPLPGVLANRYYGSATGASGFNVDGHTVYELDSAIYIDGNIIDYCADHLQGAVMQNDTIVIACSAELLWTTTAGQLIERLGSAHGVPSSIVSVGKSDARLLLDTASGVYEFDPVTLKAVRTSSQFVAPERVEVEDALLPAIAMSWEQFILDLHSGRYFGDAGVWLMDLVGVALLLLSASGITLAIRSGKGGGRGR